MSAYQSHLNKPPSCIAEPVEGTFVHFFPRPKTRLVYLAGVPRPSDPPTTRSDTTPRSASGAPNSNPWVPLSLLAVYTIWSSTYLALRYVVEAFPPLLAAGARFVVAGAVLLAVVRVSGKPMPKAREWLWAAPVGTLMSLCGNGFVSIAEKEVSSGLAAVVCAAMPLFGALFGLFLGEKPRARELVGLAIGFSGVFVMCSGGFHASKLALTLLLISPVAWALGSLLARAHFRSGMSTAAAQMLLGGIALLVVGTLRGEHVPAHIALKPALWLLYLIVFGSIITFSAYAYLLQHTRPAVAMSYAYVNPAIAVLLGVFFAGESLGASALVGGALVLFGVVVVVSREKKKDAAPQDG